MELTGSLAEELLEELEVETVFTIPIGDGIPIYESVVVSFLITAVVFLLSIIFVRNLKVENPGKGQLLLEAAICGIWGFFEDLLGKEGRKYIPYLISVAVFIGLANIIGIFGFKSPTKDMNVTVALSFMSIVLIEASSVAAKGPKKFIKSFAEPVPIVAPINILEIFIRPLSLCMRLFGNVLGAFVVMELIKLLVPAIVPVPFCLYFDLFDGLIQAYVFVFLTTLFIKESIE